MQSEKIAEYSIVANSDIIELREQVQKGIKEGWQPYGPPFTIPEGSFSRAVVVQAVVKYEKLKSL